MVTVYIGKANKKRNSTRIISTTGFIQLECLIKTQTSISNIVLDVKSSEIAGCNYCYIPMLNRYYFIFDTITTATNVWELHCTCDVLATYRSDILETKAYVLYSNIGDGMLTDPRVGISESSQVKYLSLDADIRGLDILNGTYILTTITPTPTTKSGFATTYVMDYQNIAALAQEFNTNKDFWNDLREQLLSPMDTIVSCKWIPFAKNVISATTVRVALGSYITSAEASLITQNPFHFDADIKLPFKYYSVDERGNITGYYDYRNVEPYSECKLWLPGVGFVEYSLKNHMCMGIPENCEYIRLRGEVDLKTGDITYEIGPLAQTRSSQSDRHVTDTVFIAQGNLAVELPVSAITSNSLAFIQGTASLAGLGATMIGLGSIGSVPAKMAAMATGASAIPVFANMVTNSMQTQNTIKGSMSSLMEQRYYEPWGVFRTRTLSDSTSNIATVYGRPTYKTVQLVNIKGFCQCAGASVSCNGTVGEIEQINNFLNGGVFIE